MQYTRGTNYPTKTWVYDFGGPVSVVCLCVLKTLIKFMVLICKKKKREREKQTEYDTIA